MNKFRIIKRNSKDKYVNDLSLSFVHITYIHSWVPRINFRPRQSWNRTELYLNEYLTPKAPSFNSVRLLTLDILIDSLIKYVDLNSNRWIFFKTWYELMFLWVFIFCVCFLFWNVSISNFGAAPFHNRYAAGSLCWQLARNVTRCGVFKVKQRFSAQMIWYSVTKLSWLLYPYSHPHYVLIL